MGELVGLVVALAKMSRRDNRLLDRMAQEVLDVHVYRWDGECLGCRRYSSRECPHREAALKWFAVSVGLPRRTPNVTQPELIGARRIA